LGGKPNIKKLNDSLAIMNKSIDSDMPVGTISKKKKPDSPRESLKEMERKSDSHDTGKFQNSTE